VRRDEYACDVIEAQTDTAAGPQVWPDDDAATPDYGPVVGKLKLVCRYINTGIISVNARCPVQFWNAQCLKWSIVTRAHATRQCHFLCLRTSLFLFKWRVVRGVVCAAV
jgi:hypothetical protein